jgi:hypothetical protein
MALAVVCILLFGSCGYRIVVDPLVTKYRCWRFARMERWQQKASIEDHVPGFEVIPPAEEVEID